MLVHVSHQHRHRAEERISLYMVPLSDTVHVDSRSDDSRPSIHPDPSFPALLVGGNVHKHRQDEIRNADTALKFREREEARFRCI